MFFRNSELFPSSPNLILKCRAGGPGVGRRIALDVARGLTFLHFNRIAHMDLKTLNGAHLTCPDPCPPDATCTRSADAWQWSTQGYLAGPRLIAWHGSRSSPGPLSQREDMRRRHVQAAARGPDDARFCEPGHPSVVGAYDWLAASGPAMNQQRAVTPGTEVSAHLFLT